MTIRRIILSAAVAGLLGFQGCAAAVVPLAAGGAEAGASGISSGISYSMGSTAYKTVTAPYDVLMNAIEESLKRMDIMVTETTPTDTGSKITAEAGSRTIEIELDQMTAKATQVQVLAKDGWFFRDRATAAEIIVQIEKTLANHNAPS